MKVTLSVLLLVVVSTQSFPQLQSEKQSDKATTYDGCGQTKGCFGIPAGCVKDKKCTLLGTYRKDGTSYTFEVEGRGPHYLAIGLSDNDKMGEDSVIECSQDGSGFLEAATSWNEVFEEDKNKNTRDAKPAAFVTKWEARNIDGLLTCTFTRDATSEHRGKKFDLSQPWHVLVAQGAKREDGKAGVGYHAEEKTFTAKVALDTPAIL